MIKMPAIMPAKLKQETAVFPFINTLTGMCHNVLALAPLHNKHLPAALLRFYLTHNTLFVSAIGRNKSPQMGDEHESLAYGSIPNLVDNEIRYRKLNWRKF